jgi:hypothetical protein
MKKLLLILITFPLPLLASEKKEPDFFETYGKSSGFCAQITEDRPSLDPDISGDEKIFQERLIEEICKIRLLNEKIEKGGMPPHCKAAELKEKSACFAHSIEMIHARQPLSSSGIVLFSALQLPFIMKERKAEAKKENDKHNEMVDTVRKILRLNTQNQKMLKSRAKMAAWIGKENKEIQKQEDSAMLSYCEKFKKSGESLLSSLPDAKMLKSLEKEKKEFEALGECKAN